MMKTIKLAFFPLAFALFSAVAWADFDSATKAFSESRYEEAYQQFLEVAKEGDYDAQFNVGAMLYQGQGVGKNPVESYAWIALSTQDSSEAKRETARQKLLNNLSEEEKANALARSDELRDLYGDEAIIEKSSPVLLSNADCDFKLKMRGVFNAEYPRKMYERNIPGWVDVSFTVAKDGTTRNHGVVGFSDKEFVDAAVDGVRRVKFDAPSLNGKPIDIHGHRLRIAFYPDNGTQFSERKVLGLMREQKQKALTGSVQDKYQYAYMLDIIPGYTKIPVEDKDSNEWYWQSARGGHTQSQFFLGRNLLYGKGCRAEPQKGANWLTIAANKDQPDAQYLLAVELAAGNRMERNEKRAVALLEKAATRNYWGADVALAWIYSTHPDASMRDSAKAQARLDTVGAGYIDTVTLNEARAATSAEAGNFKSAVEHEKAALSEARLLRFPEATLKLMQTRLKRYEEGAPWRETI